MRGQLNFSLKGQIVNILGVTGSMMSIATTQFYPCGMTRGMDNM